MSNEETPPYLCPPLSVINLHMDAGKQQKQINTRSIQNKKRYVHGQQAISGSKHRSNSADGITHER
jgi:hypothetical protein